MVTCHQFQSQLASKRNIQKESQERFKNGRGGRIRRSTEKATVITLHTVELIDTENC